MAQFPQQNISELKKDLDWVKKHFEYAESLLKDSDGRISKFTRLYNSYNGTTDPLSVAYLTKQYGQRNRTKYISYRIARSKIDLLNYEFLLRPLQATVYTVNAQAKANKLDSYEMMLGAAYAKEPLDKLLEAGVDPLEGMSVPPIQDEDAWNNLSIKDKYEELMQTILDHQIPSLNIKHKLSNNFQDAEITSMCYGQIYVNEKGDEDFKRIDPRNAIFEEIENDYFIEKSPVMGHVEKMPIHNIMLQFNLNTTQLSKLEQIRTNPDHYINNSSYNNQYYYRNGQVCANVIFLEWKSVEPLYYKISPKTKKQLEFDNSTESITIKLDTESYLKNEEYHKKMVEKGEYNIEVKYREVLWEAVRIGDDIIPIARKKQFTLRREDFPADVIGFSYVGFLFNTVSGERVSLMQIIENFSNIFDITMYQILKDLNKAKGKILGYNRATLPKGRTVKQVMYNVLNDSYLEYDSTGQGNMSGRDIDIQAMFKEIDIGLSSSFPALIQLKQEILSTVDRLTGINENREGQIAASSTASNAQQAIQASRTITEGLFYGMALYSERVLMKLVETTKLTWGLNKQNKAKLILGDARFKFMQITKELAYQDYSIHLTDGGKEMRIREKVGAYAESALNSKDLRFKDLIKFELAPTLSEANKVLDKAFVEMDKIKQRDMKIQNDANANMAQQQQQQNIQLAREDREDKQLHEIEKIDRKADADIRVKVATSAEDHRNKMIVDQNKLEQESFNNDTQQ